MDERNSIQASMWRIWQQCSKSLPATDDSLEIGLLAPTRRTPTYRPRFAEAKRYDIRLTFLRAGACGADRKALGSLVAGMISLDGEWASLARGPRRRLELSCAKGPKGSSSR